MKHIAAMRMLIAILALVLAACGRQAPPADERATLKTGIYYQQNGRGSICISPGEKHQRAVFITFAKSGMTNCSASGTLQPAGEGLMFVPQGEEACRIPIDRQGDRLTLHPGPAACAYYCGPGVSLGGQTFDWTDASTADLQAEPLMPNGEHC